MALFIVLSDTTGPAHRDTVTVTTTAEEGDTAKGGDICSLMCNLKKHLFWSAQFFFFFFSGILLQGNFIFFSGSNDPFIQSIVRLSHIDQFIHSFNDMLHKKIYVQLIPVNE